MHQYACVCQSSASFFQVQLIYDVHKILLYDIIICHISVIVSIYLNSSRDMTDKSPSQTVSLKNIIRKTASFLLKVYKQFTQTLNMEILTMLYFTQGYKKKSLQFAVLHCKSGRYQRLAFACYTTQGGKEQNRTIDFIELSFPFEFYSCLVRVCVCLNYILGYLQRTFGNNCIRCRIR